MAYSAHAKTSLPIGEVAAAASRGRVDRPQAGLVDAPDPAYHPREAIFMETDPDPPRLNGEEPRTDWRGGEEPKYTVGAQEALIKCRKDYPLLTGVLSCMILPPPPGRAWITPPPPPPMQIAS